MAKVSVIVPVYNVEKYVSRCLESLISQTLKDIEIIVVNDGSTDNSKKIIQKYISKIKYLEKENGGLSSARNYGMKYATGDYIAFLDSDDYVEENMYEEMYKKAIQENADLVECDFIWEWNNRKKYDKRRKYKDKSEMLKKPRVVAWNKLFKKEIIEKNNIEFPEGLIYEDIEFYYKIMPYINKISYVNKFLVHYTQREDSISKLQNERNNDIFIVIQNIFDYYINNDFYEKYKKELNYMKRRIIFGSSLKRIIKIKDKKIKMKLLLKTIRFKPTFSNRNKYKICFGITKLGIGGAERVLVDMINELSTEYDITVFTIYEGGELEKELNSNINTVSLYQKQTKLLPVYIFLFGKHIYNKYLKNKYDLYISFLEGPITRIFSFKGDWTWVHNDINKVFGNNLKSKIKIIIDKHFYKKYKKIVFVSEQNKKEFEKLYGNISKREVIYNYINKERVLKLARENADEINHELPCIVTISRLVKQKGIDRFIRVHKMLIDEGITHRVYIIGDGEEKDNLKKLVEKYNVEDTFKLLGKKINPYPYVKNADYIALLSYFEGYGMVLEEAKILDKPIIITDTAAKEAVKDYKKSIIVPNNEKEIFYGLKDILLKREML